MYSYSASTDEAGIIGVLVFYLIYFLVMIGFSIALYVLRALGVYTIAKRRQIDHPWFAWVPVVDHYLLGCISDQYQYVVKGKNKAKRKVLLVLSGIFWAAYIVFFVFLIAFLVNTVTTAASGAGEAALVREMLGSLVGFMGILVVLAGVSIAMTVVRYIALYDLYRSCDPNNSVMYLVLGIFFNVTEPFFIFFSRKKDQGMPPRKTAQQEPAKTIDAAPQWQPPEPPAEPWEQNTEE